MGKWDKLPKSNNVEDRRGRDTGRLPDLGRRLNTVADSIIELGSAARAERIQTDNEHEAMRRASALNARDTQPHSSPKPHEPNSK